MAKCEKYVRNTLASSPLLRFAQDKTSQGGEDGIIQEIFRYLPPPSAGRPRSCCEVGSWDGKWLSNTYTLLAECGWGGLLLEADSARSAQAADMYRAKGKLRERGDDKGDGVVCVSALVAFQDETKTPQEQPSASSNTLPSLFDSLNADYPGLVPPDLDLLSIDIDGNDLHVWRTLLQQKLYRPVLVIIEFNPTIPNDVDFRQVPDMAVQQGSSLRALAEGLAFAHGYCLVCATTYNAFFVRAESMLALAGALAGLPTPVQELYAAIQANHAMGEGASIEEQATATVTATATAISSEQRDTFSVLLDALHAPSMVTGLFQTYEGELKLVGPRKLLWHRLAINPQRIQVLPPRQRKFPFAPKRLAGAEAGVSTATATVTASDVQSENSSKYGITRGREKDVTDEAFDTARAAVLEALPDPARLSELARSLVLPLIGDTLTVHRYQERAVLLGLSTLSAIEQHSASSSLSSSSSSSPSPSSAQTQAYTGVADQLCLSLSVLFEKQAGILLECQGEEAAALLWLQRAEHVRTAQSAPVHASTLAPELLRKLCRSARLAGELTAYRHYTYSLLAAAQQQVGRDCSAGGRERENEFLADARKDVLRMHAALKQR